MILIGRSRQQLPPSTGSKSSTKSPWTQPNPTTEFDCGKHSLKTKETLQSGRSCDRCGASAVDSQFLAGGEVRNGETLAAIPKEPGCKWQPVSDCTEWYLVKTYKKTWSPISKIRSHPSRSKNLLNPVELIFHLVESTIQFSLWARKFWGFHRRMGNVEKS